MIQLPPMPPAIEKLPRDERGYPVPWFVAWIDGKPEFRAVTQEKIMLAVKESRCWVCGERRKRGKDNWPDMAFVLGPMCTISRTSAEPPSHYECAIFSAKACPFLTKPKAVRREAGLPEETRDLPGIAIMRNPGVTAIWRCRDYQPFRVEHGLLFTVGDPISVEWFAEGRRALRSEVEASIESGLPILMDAAKKDNSVPKLLAQRDLALQYLPA